MRNSKLDGSGFTLPETVGPATRGASPSKRWLVLQRISSGDGAGPRAWPARLLRLRVRVAVVAAIVAVLWAGDRLWRSDAFMVHQQPSPCSDAFAAQRWLEASVACTGEVDRADDSAAGVRAAGALLHLERRDEALAAAQRWFGSNDDAMARQIAGAVYFERDQLAQAISLLEPAFMEHVGRRDHQEASRDAGYLAGLFLHASSLGAAVDASEASVWEADLTTQDDAHTQLRGRARLRLGKLMTEIGDFSSARTQLWAAQQVLSKWPADQAWVFLQLGELLQAEDDHASAAALFERALELASKAGVAQPATAARLNLAYIRRELGQLDAAELQIAELDEATREQPMALFVAGLIAADRGHQELAEPLLARAAAGAPTDDYAMDIAFQRGRLAERASDPSAAEQYYRTAIALVEKLRENTSLRALRPWVLARRLAPYRMLLALLARQDRRLDALVVAEQLHARSWLDALVGHAGAGSVRAKVLAELSLGRRLHADATGAPSLDELLALLRGREALVFSEAEADVWRFHIIDSAVVRLDRLPGGAQSLFARWRMAPNDLALADALGDLLIPPVARTPSQRPLYIVTNGTLGTLPFAALRPAGRYLIEDRVISRLPGIVALRCPTHHVAQRSGVFLGDSRDDLAAARTETRALADRFGGTPLVGSDATVERLEASRGAALLHLAVHADVDHSGARLLLANQREVTVADIVERGIGPRVVVLAGCATAIGRDPEGWGALSSAFLAAGSRSVVGTLRSVTDLDAAELVRRFYAHGGEVQPAIALANAQRELLTTAPSMWGAFVVYGSADAADCVASL